MIVPDEIGPFGMDAIEPCGMCIVFLQCWVIE